MGKDRRSGSRRKEKDHHKEKQKDKQKKDHKDRKEEKFHKRRYSRSSSRSIRKKRSVSRDRWRKNRSISSSKTPEKQQILQKIPQIENIEENLDQEALMAKIMGFTSFSSSKDQDHTESAVSACNKLSSQKRKYRQYMCRKGGFNRILDSV